MINTEQLTGSKTYQGKTWAYFSAKEREALSAEHKDQLFYLDKDSTEQVYKAADNYDITCGDDSWGNKPFSAGSINNMENGGEICRYIFYAR